MTKDCPIYREPCHEHACEFYIHLTGTHPQTGDPLDHWGCAISWMPILQIECSQRVNQLGAAVESLRNKMVEGNNALIQIGLQNLTALPTPPGNQHELFDITPIDVTPEDITPKEE